MKKILKSLSIIILFVAFFFSQGCQDKLDSTTYFVSEQVLITQYMDQHPDTFSEFVEILKKTNYYDALNSVGRYTCFVPTNTALKEYVKNRWNVNSVSELTTPEQLSWLKDLAKYHILRSAQYTSGFKEGRMNDTTLSGDYLTISFAAGGGIANLRINKSVKLIAYDKSLDNGAVHLIDRVLNPVVDYVPSALEKTGKYTIFVEALKLTSLYDTLSQNIRGNRRFRFTLFAEPDSIFKISNINSIDDLISKVSPDRSDYTDATNPLNRFLAYHVIIGYWYLFDLPENDLLATYLANNAIKVVKGRTLKINPDVTPTSEKWVSIITPLSNNPAKNGAYHMLDTIMNIFLPKPERIIFDIGDQVEILTGQIKFGQWVYNGAFAKIHWDQTVANPNTRIQKQASSGADPEYKGTRMDTPPGWVTFETPPIPKGRYTLIACSRSGTTRALVQVYFDGKPVGGTYNIKYGSNGPLNQWVNNKLTWDNGTGPAADSAALYKIGWKHNFRSILSPNGLVSGYSNSSYMRCMLGEILCPEQASHIIKIVGNSIPLDYFEFEPIN